MKLNEEEYELLISNLIQKVVIDYDNMRKDDKQEVREDLKIRLGDCLSALPEGAKAEAMPLMEPFFREQAIDFLLKELRKVNIYKSADAFELLDKLSEELIDRTARFLFTLTVVALEILEEDNALLNTLNKFPDYNLDEEFKRLIEDT